MKTLPRSQAAPQLPPPARSCHLRSLPQPSPLYLPTPLLSAHYILIFWSQLISRMHIHGYVTQRIFKEADSPQYRIPPQGNSISAQSHFRFITRNFASSTGNQLRQASFPAAIFSFKNPPQTSFTSVARSRSYISWATAATTRAKKRFSTRWCQRRYRFCLCILHGC